MIDFSQHLFFGIIHVINIILIIKGSLVHGDSETSALNRFSAELFRNIILRNNASNVIVAPLGLSSMLTMIAYEAEGETKKALENMLHISTANDKLQKKYQSILDQFKTIDNPKTHVANKRYLQNNIPLNHTFEKTTNRYFHTYLEFIDFQNKTAAANIINNWTSNQKNNSTTSLIKPDDLDGAQMMLMSNFAFEGKWENPFDISASSLGAFQIDSKTVVNVPMMTSLPHYADYDRLPNFDAHYIVMRLEFHRVKSAINMVIIIPDKIEELEKIEKNLPTINFLNFTGKPFIPVSITMPKFRIENKIDIKPILEQMTRKNIFEDNTNFSGITNTSLKLTHIMQSAVIDVNEVGIGITPLKPDIRNATKVSAEENEKPQNVMINKSFICALVHRRSGIPISYARIVDPRTDRGDIKNSTGGSSALYNNNGSYLFMMIFTVLIVRIGALL